MRKTSARILKNGAIPILTPPFSHFPQQKTPQQPSIRTPPFLAFALFTPRSLPLHRTFHAFPPSSIHPQSPSIRAQLFRLPTFTPLVFRVLRAFPWQKTPIGGLIAKKMPPVWQKTSLGGLIRQEMRRPLDHIGKGSLLPRRKTAGQRITHYELPQDAQNPSPATRPPSGVFCQMSPASPQCPLGSPSKQSDW